jgi:ribosomal protein S18 acetylase RimI-like enzyme
MKLHCSTGRRRQTSMWKGIFTTATIIMQKQHSMNIISAVVGKWFVMSILKTTASAILATTNTNTYLPRTSRHRNQNHDIFHHHFSSDCSGSSSISSSSSLSVHMDSHSEDYSSRCASAKPLVTTWSPPVPFRPSSSWQSNVLLHNQQCHRLYSAASTAASTTTATNTGTTNPDEVVNSNSNFDEFEQQGHHIASGSSCTKRISKASAQPHQPHDRNVPSSAATTTKLTNVQPQDGTRAVQTYDIKLRLATMSDIASISSCNIQTLPENYNDMFYMNHIHEHPYLSFVAVIDEPNTTTEDDDEEAQQSRQRRIHGNYEPNHVASSNPKPLGFIQRHLQMSKRRFATTFWTPQQQYGEYNGLTENRDRHTTATKSIVVGYLLGKITAPQEPYQYMNYQNSNNMHSFGGSFNKYNLNSNDEHNYQSRYRSETSHEMIGHVSSLAVLPEARRRGLARALLEQFHHHLSTTNSMRSSSSSSLNQMNHPSQNDKIVVTSTGLHVRCSNVVAVKLYETLGYIPAVTIPSYYEDGEDAYYMQKIFGQQQNQYVAPEGQRQNQRDGVKVHDDNNNNSYRSDCHTDDYQLPRVISVLSLEGNDVELPETKRDDNNRNDCKLSDSSHSNDKHVIAHEEEEEEEHMLMNGSV